MSVLPPSPLPGELPHETLHVVKGRRSGLTISIAVHSTTLGPALGGCRLLTYDSWQEAVADSLRLPAAAPLGDYVAELRVWARGDWQTVARESVRDECGNELLHVFWRGLPLELSLDRGNV